MKELERHRRERSGAGGRKVGTGVAPQALFAPQRMNVKIFKVDDMSSFLKVYVYGNAEHIFVRQVSERGKLSTPLLPQQQFARAINGHRTRFLKMCTARAPEGHFGAKSHPYVGRDKIFRKKTGREPTGVVLRSHRFSAAGSKKTFLL